jgi:thioredoxin reductase (NADPH)
VETADLTIIGAGPAGLYGAFYGALRGLRVRLFEALPFAGGQIAALYPEKTILDVGGLPLIRGADLVARLTEQAAFGQPDIHFAEQVRQLRRAEDGFALETTLGRYRTRAVLVATGVGSFAPKPLGTEAVDRWTGRGVRHALGEPRAFAGRECVVVGGGDSALDWALELADAGARVTLVHRRDHFRGAEASVARAEASGVRILRSCALEALLGGDRPQRAVVRDLRSGLAEEIPCAEVILALGFAADLSLLRAWELPLDGRGVIVAPDSMAVAPGIYAAGDVTAYPGKLKLIATAFAEAALAVSACKQALDPAARLQAGHSSELGRAERG